MYFVNSFRYFRAVFSVPFFATLLSGVAVQAADFTVVSGVTDTNTKNLTAGETGTVDAGGVLNSTGALYAVTASGNGVSITNNGTITSTNSTYNIYLYGGANNTTLTNNGTITAGTTAIRVNSDNNTLMNSSTITATNSGISLIFSSNDNTIINSGTITSTNGDGIRAALSSNTTIVNNGTITTTAAGKSAIYSTGANSTITIGGSVIASGAATQAITASNNHTLNIMPGATIVGTIDLGVGTNAVNVYTTSGARSSTFTIANAGTVNISSGGDGLVLQSGTKVAVVDPTALVASRAGLGATTVDIHQSVSQQLARSNKPQAVQVAASELEPGMLYQEQMPFAWGQIFGGHKKRGDDGTALAYTNNTVGAIGGYERSIGEHSIGVFGGASQSTMKTDVASLKANSDGFFVGGYGEYAINAWAGSWALDGTLVAGYQRHDNERLVVDNLKGEETARSDYHSVYISPSVALIRTLDMGDGLVLRPSAEVNYTYGYYDRYTETGTTSSNLTVDNHGVDVVNTRLQLAARQPFARGLGEWELRGGATYSYLGRDSTDISLNNGAPVHYKGTGDRQSHGGYVGANTRYDVGTQLTVVADMEYGRASRDEETVTGHIGLEYRY